MKAKFFALYFPCIVAALAGLLFGYDVGVISGAQIFIARTFHADSVHIGLLVSMVPFGALFGAICCGFLSDLFGRKKLLLITAVLFIVGSLICATAYNFNIIVLGRLILGLSVGLGSFSAPLYIAEISHKSNRGALVTLNQLAITSGIMFSYMICWIFAPHAQWRIMLALGILPAILLFLGTMTLPRSPRWLLKQGMPEYAASVLTRIYGEVEAVAELEEMRRFVGRRQLSIKEMIRAGFLDVLLLGILVSALTQAVGVNAIIYYAPKIFQQAGFGLTTAAISATTVLGLINVLFTVVAIYLLDRVGRRKMLLTGLGGIFCSLLTLTFIFAYHDAGPLWLAWVAFIAVTTFIAFQAVSTGPACWLIPSEIFPLQVRGLGMSVSVAFNWGTNIIVTFMFPVILHHAGPSVSFGLFLMVALFAWLLFYRILPETQGVSLEAIEQHLKEGKSMRHLGT